MTETEENFNNKIFGFDNRKSKKLRIKKKKIKLGLTAGSCSFGPCTVLNPITNKYEPEYTTESHTKYAQSRTYENRGKYRTYMRSVVIDEEFVAPTIYMRQRNHWDCQAYKPKLFYY